jgi:hypothetical protein
MFLRKKRARERDPRFAQKTSATGRMPLSWSPHSIMLVEFSVERWIKTFTPELHRPATCWAGSIFECRVDQGRQ